MAFPKHQLWEITKGTVRTMKEHTALNAMQMPLEADARCGEQKIPAMREDAREQKSEMPAVNGFDSSASSTSKNASSTRTSGGVFLSEQVYIDSHLRSAMKMSEVRNAATQSDMGAWDHYRQALVNSDIEQLRKHYTLRGIDPVGHSRNTIIDKLL